MSTLIREETSRASSREVVRFLSIAGAASVVLACLITGVRSSPPSASDWVYAREASAQARQDCLNVKGGAELTACDTGRLANWLPPGLNVSDIQSLPFTLHWAGLALAMGAWLLGATLVGAEWPSGTVAILTTWEPRRGRLLGAKLSAAALVSAAIGAGIVIALILGMTTIAQTRGLSDAPAGFWWGISATSLRIVILSGISATMAAAVAFIARSATAASAVLFGYFIAIEGVARAGLPAAERWLLVGASMPWITGSRWGAGDDAVAPMVMGHFDVAALGILIAWMISSVLVARWLFLRRDVV